METWDVSPTHVMLTAQDRYVTSLDIGTFTNQKSGANMSEPLHDTSLQFRSLNSPPMRVQLHVADDEMAALLRRVTECFSNVSYASPFRDDDLSNFFAVGEGQLYSMDMAAKRCNVSLAGVQSCLELGCGHGRATIPLSHRFPRVTAVDVSVPHLTAAADNAKRVERDNILFVHGNSTTWMNDLEPIDLFFSKFALQHSSPPIQYAVLNALLPKIRLGGFAYFQVATYGLGYDFDVQKYLASPMNFTVPEMHMMPQHELLGLLDRYGMRILEVREDPSAGKDCISLHILAMRK